MTSERLTLQEMEEKYPDEWLLIVDCEINERTELLSGKVVAHSKHRKDIRDVSGHYMGHIATHYTGRTPEGLGYLL